MLSRIVPPVMFPRVCMPGLRCAWAPGGPVPAVRWEDVLPAELPRLRESALTGGRKYAGVIDVLRDIYGQDFGAILKRYVDTHPEELYRQGIMRDSLVIRFGGTGRARVEADYDQPARAFYLDVVVDCLLEGEHYQQCVALYIRYRLSFCVMDPKCFLCGIGVRRKGAGDGLRGGATRADGNLLPVIGPAGYDEIVETLLDRWDPEALASPRPVDVYGIAAGLGLTVREVPMRDRNILGQMHFVPGTVEHPDGCGGRVATGAGPMGIFINTLGCTTQAARRSSLAHELGHVFCSRMFGFLQIMAGNRRGAVVNHRKKRPGGAGVPRKLEAQPSKFSGHLLLPRRTALPFVEGEIEKLGGRAGPTEMEAVVRKVMGTFQVSRQMATLRLKDFGYDVAKGVNRFVDGHYVPAYGTGSGEWKAGVDYVIEHRAVFELYFDDPRFREVIDTGRFVFAESHLCLADRRYVAMDLNGGSGAGAVRLTAYARNHIDECCLAFRGRGAASGRAYDGFLNREICRVVRDYRFDPSRTPEENAQTLAEYGEITANLPDGFGPTLKYHMKRVQVTTESLAEAMEISPRVLYDYRRTGTQRASLLAPADAGTAVPAVPTRKNVVTMSLLMHLMPAWTKHFLRQAHLELSMDTREELAWSCAVQTSYMCEIEQINQQFRLLGVPALTSRFPG